jgi:hypothetical protein
MANTATTDIKAITLTANAKAVGQTHCVDLVGLQAQAAQHAAELQAIMKQIIAFHPVGGGDASNLTALNAVLTEIS